MAEFVTGFIMGVILGVALLALVVGADKNNPEKEWHDE